MKYKLNSARISFASHLKNLRIVSWFLKSIPIPIGILTASVMANIVSEATAGSVRSVLINSALLISVMLGMKLFEIITNIAYHKSASKAKQQCKLLLYRNFLGSPLSVLYKSEHGKNTENINNDFETVINIDLELIPGVFVGIITAVVYFVFLSAQNIYVSLVLIGMSLLQIVPPVIVKKYMQANYDDCRKIEAELTEYTMQAYYGFSEIKLYGLKKWWLDGLAKIHKRYLKIGNRSTVTAEAEGALERLISNLLRYGTYGILGIFVLAKLAPIEAAVKAIALSEGLFAAVHTVLSSISKFAVAHVAEKRLSSWFAPRCESKGDMKNAMIRLSDISLSFDGKVIFDHMSCELDAARLTILHGKNGAGKSTLFHLITGILPPDSGAVSVGGLSAEHLSYPAEIFCLPQEDALFHFTPKELYAMVLNERADTAFQLAKRFDLSNELLSDSPIDTLSGGERKKVFLSLAFAVNPKILLLDEPTNSLDEAAKNTLLTLLTDRKKGAVIITHDTVLEKIAEETFCINEGGISFER